MSQFYGNCPPFWSSNEPQISESLSNNLSLKMEPPQFHHKARCFDFHIPDQDSSSSHSTHSNQDFPAPAGANSQDQCLSSDSGQEVSCGKNVGDHGKPFYLMGHSDWAFNSAQNDYNQTMAGVTYPNADMYFNGLLTTYGTPPIVQPQGMGVSTARIPLPLDLSEDEFVYVNAKQYHGILRRRQFRAKMEAQNKLIKVRKPYLHKSRHLHALNRVRGSGGRFLSTKNLQQQNSNSSTGTSSTTFDHNKNTLFFEQHPCHHHHQSQTMETNAFHDNEGSYYQLHEHGFMGISSSHNMERDGGGFVNGSNQKFASVVQ